VLKEARALLPIWLAAAAAVAVGVVAAGNSRLFPRSPELFLLGLVAFVLGAVALGAFSIGHEYAHRTLPALLTQPVSRSWFLLSKAAALIPLLVVLAFLARWMLLRADANQETSTRNTGAWIDTFTILVPILGLCVAPWLTMIFRNAIAGVVFTLAIPAAFWLAINVLPVIGGFDILQNYALVQTIFRTGILAVSALVLVDVPRRFVRLEATDGLGETSAARTRRQHVQSGTEAGRRRRPLAQLVIKELRLQRVAFLLPVFYVLARAAIVAAGLESSLGPAFFGMTVLYCGMTAMLVGALASAEERALGTLAVQMLQPIAAWKQWLVKASTALALTAAFTVLLPWVLEWVHPLGEGQVNVWLSGAFLAFTACSLYVSSLSAGALQALLLSMSFVAVAGPLFQVTTEETTKLVWLPLTPVLRSLSADWTRPMPLLSSADSDWYNWSDKWLQLAVLCGLIGLLIWSAAKNHRSAEHGLGRARRQLAWIAPCVLVGALISGALPPLLLWFLATH
jgi:hypothetical protein